jgi:hypothetical protein
MALRDGWMIVETEDGERIVYALLNGSPIQVDAGNAAIIGALEPGYYDLEFNQVDEDEATAPEAGQ